MLFCYIMELLGVRGEVYEFKCKMDYIHDTQHFYFTHFICGLWSLFIFHLSEMVTKPKEK